MEPTQTQQPSSPLMIPLAIVVAGLLIAGALIYTSSGTQVPSAPVADTSGNTHVNIAPITASDHILGNPKATLLVVEYSDLECPYCKQFQLTLKQMMTDFGQKSDVAWVYRHFPLYKGTETRPALHSKSGKESEASECANELGGANAFWKYIDTVYEITPSNNGLDPAKLPDIAEQIGLDRTKFTACLSSGKYASKIEADYNEGVTAGAQGTPYTVIVDSRNGKTIPIDAGAIPYASLSALLKTILTSSTN